MAYMSQEKKRNIKVELDKILKATGIKYSLGVRNHSTIVLNISKGPIDFIKNFVESTQDSYNNLSSGKYDTILKSRYEETKYIDVNPYHYDRQFTGKALEIIDACVKAMNQGNHDKSDIQSDYFDVGWYIDINIGQWNKPYEFTGEKK